MAQCLIFPGFKPQGKKKKERKIHTNSIYIQELDNENFDIIDNCIELYCFSIGLPMHSEHLQVFYWHFYIISEMS